MQPALCILIIVLTLGLFWFGMNRTNSDREYSIKKVADALENQEASNARRPPPPTVEKDRNPNPSELVPTVSQRARAALLIQLPPTQRPRSNSESFSLKETYLGLHKEFITSDRFHDYMILQIRNNFDLGSILAGSFKDGPITHSEILRNRLLFSLETNGENGAGPVLVLEAIGETSEAAMELVGLAQREYLRFVRTGDTPSGHPRLSKQASRLGVLQEENQSLENDLTAYQQLNKRPAQKNQEDELEQQLAYCKEKKTGLANQLKAISRAFAANPETIVPLAQLEGFAASKSIGQLGEQLGQLERLTVEYRSGSQAGRAEKIQKLEETSKNIRTRLREEMNRSIALLKNQFETLLNREIALTEELVRVQNDFVNLAREYPKAPLLRASRRALVDFKQQHKQSASNWSQACKYLIAGELSKSVPPLRLQP